MNDDLRSVSSFAWPDIHEVLLTTLLLEWGKKRFLRPCEGAENALILFQETHAVKSVTV